jgi:CHAT domain-containing protein
MLKKITLLVINLLLLAWLYGQCPDRSSLRHTILFLRDSSNGPVLQRRDSLLAFEQLMNNCPDRYDSTHVLLLRALSGIYSKQNNYPEATRYMLQAIEVIRHVPNNKAVNLTQLSGTYYWLSRLHNSVNNVAEELKALDSCATIAGRFGIIDRSVFYALYRRAEYYYDLGDYHHCITFTKACEELASKYIPGAEKSEQDMARSYARSSFVWRINSLIRLKNYPEAEYLMNERLSKPGIGRLANYPGLVYSLRAEMAVHKRSYAESEILFRQAIAWELKEKNLFTCKQLKNIMARGVYYQQYRAYEKALSLYREALQTVNHDTRYEKEDSLESMNIWSNMAEVYVAKGMFEEAFRCFHKAWEFIGPGANRQQMVNRPPAEIIEQKKIHYLTGLMTGEGDAYLKKYFFSHQKSDLRQAIEIYKMTDNLVNKIKEEQASLNSKLFWRSNSHDLYEHALEACYAAGNLEDAFYFFEKSRAVLLNDQLTEQRWMGESDILLLTQAQRRINALNRELDAPGITDARKNDLNAEGARLQIDFDRLSSTIRERNPFYYQNFIDHDFASVQKVRQSLLTEYQALVELFSGDSAVYLMVITARDLQLRKINKPAFDSLAGKFVTYLSNRELQNNQWETFTATAHQLYQLLFRQDPLPAGRIIISPDGPYFPFEALLTSTQPLVYFLQDHAVSYTYSARYLLNDFAGATNKKAKNFMGVAPVHCAGPGLAELLGSDEALEKLSDYFPAAENFTGKAASKNNFLQQFADYRIIQLYTHAAGNKEQGEPVIYFSDSLLYLSDLASNRKPATGLVVLSACETGLGKVYQGEGVFNFNRGFAALGIPAAITSLWVARNDKTYELTALFYKYLSMGEPADVALQKAKLAFMQTGDLENRMPYLWAVPVLTGKVTSLTQTPFFSWPMWVAAGIGVVVLLYLLVKYGRRALRQA